MASITPYNDGRYRAVVRRTGFKVRSKIFPTERQAKAWARAIETEMDQSQYSDPGEGMKATVRSLLVKFRDEVAPDRRGSRWEKVRINHLLKTTDFVERRLEQLRSEDIRQWRDARLKQISGASVNREMNLLSGVFTHAIKEWGIPLKQNPISMVKRPPNGKPRTRRWDDGEIEALLKASEFDETKQPVVGREFVGWAVLLAIETAMRLGELCSIHVKDVDLEARTVTLHQTKNGDSRQVPLSSRALELLRKLVDGKKQTDRLIPLSSESLGVCFREARNRAGLKNLRFHDTRHEAATRLSKKLSNVLELSAVTGHRSLQSLKIYYNPKASELAHKLD